MAEPVVELISQALAARLLTITLAGGYSIELTDVVRPTQFGLPATSPRDGVAALLEGDDEEIEPPGELPAVQVNRSRFEKLSQEYLVEIYLRQSEKDSRDPALAVPIGRRVNRVKADVRKAIGADRSLGGLVQGTFVRSAIAYQVEQAEFSACLLMIEVVYRTVAGDPYTKV